VTRLLTADVLTADLEPLATLGASEVGVAVRLHAGDRTTWTVTEALRKVYVAT
jgi:uncharacterized cupin superfamily protein